MLYFLRENTGPKTWAMSQVFLGAEPNSVWRKIYENHMTDENFRENEFAVLQAIQDSNKLETVYYPLASLLYFSKSCELKILWTSPDKWDLSFGFPKRSPLIPFFKYAYKKLRQVGTLKRISEKLNRKSSKCESTGVKPISVNTIGSLLVLLSFGFLLAVFIFLMEKLLKIDNKWSTRTKMISFKSGRRMVEIE